MSTFFFLFERKRDELVYTSDPNTDTDCVFVFVVVWRTAVGRRQMCACAGHSFLHPGIFQFSVWLRRREMATSGAVNKT